MLGVNSYILADGRWSGLHGIGRFSAEILSRLQHTDVFYTGPKPLSIQNVFWQHQKLQRESRHYKVFFTPGFNPVLRSPIPFVLTIHDLIHLFAPGNAQFLKKNFYQFLLKPSVKQAEKILTVSEYSKKMILEWSNISAEKVSITPCGVSQHMIALGTKHQPGFPYILHVGNAEKIHKNVHRLLQAFAQVKSDTQLRLIFTHELSTESWQFIRGSHLEKRILVEKNLSEENLAAYYRGAEAVVFPSLYEGFGLPVLEGMACGVPVLTANVTSLPEVASDAALLVDPFSVDAIAVGIEKIMSDTALRATLTKRGLERAALFSWDKTAQKIQAILDTF